MYTRRVVPVLLVLSLAVSARPSRAQYTDPGPIAGGSCRPYVGEGATTPAVWSQWFCLNLLLRQLPISTGNVQQLGARSWRLPQSWRGVRR